MPLLPFQLTKVTVDDLHALIGTKAREDQDIDFKLKLPDLDGKNGPKAKRALLTDVAALANARGGDIVFGVEEGRDGAGQPNGVAVALPGVHVENLDALERRWVQIIETGLDPKVTPSVEIHAVTLASGTIVLVLRVPRSISSPHMLRDHGWFPTRRGAQNLTLNTGELRAAFELSERWSERVRKFRQERIAQVIAGATPVTLHGVDRFVLHIVPLVPGVERTRVDVSLFKAAEPLNAASSWGPRFNLDGLAVVADASGDQSHSYVQFFRDGAVEVVTQAASVTREGYFFPGTYEKLTMDSLRRYVPLIRNAAVLGPLVVMLSLAGLLGLQPVDPDPFPGPRGRPRADRELYALPDFVLTSEIDNIDVVVRPIFDTLWQCFGFHGSPNFDANGRWTGPR